MGKIASRGPAMTRHAKVCGARRCGAVRHRRDEAGLPLAPAGHSRTQRLHNTGLRTRPMRTVPPSGSPTAWALPPPPPPRDSVPRQRQVSWSRRGCGRCSAASGPRCSAEGGVRVVGQARRTPAVAGGPPRPGCRPGLRPRKTPAGIGWVDVGACVGPPTGESLGLPPRQIGCSDELVGNACQECGLCQRPL